MSETIAQRIFIAHLALNFRMRRKITQAEFGALIAEQLGRHASFTAAAVSRWEAGTKLPHPSVVEAIAAVTHTDPGWISHGARSAAPAPHTPAALFTDQTQADDDLVDIRAHRAKTRRKTPAKPRRAR